ncbi:hypothetical protein [Curvivirga sp.]|uniref:helix-turn-helix transcriptional regulator n=1 Tax=Curvivirga sp. TaxID=2856848 RepID=UPI003B59E125
MLTLNEVVDCEHINDFNTLMDKHNIKYVWQKVSADYFHIYDYVGSNFLGDYFGEDVDLICPVAWAYRSKLWPIFTHDQARNEARFNSINNSEQAYEVWHKHGFVDGILCLSGRPTTNSFAFFSSKEHISNLDEVEIAYFAATRKLDKLLEGNADLIKIARKFKFLSEKEVETLKLQMTQPHLSTAEQAERLGISQSTLKIRQERITKKFGVKRFIGAALLVERTGFLD